MWWTDITIVQLLAFHVCCDIHFSSKTAASFDECNAHTSSSTPFQPVFALVVATTLVRYQVMDVLASYNTLIL